MKLLICTQKVDINDDLLGFFHSWIAEFAKNCEQVTVVCLEKREYDLPDNVRVLSLGKEEISKKLKVCKAKSSLSYVCNLYKYIWKERNNYDSVFVHMNQIYVLLGGIFWRMWQKKVVLWYAHGHVSLGLRIAEKFVDDIFTSTASGCRMKSDKIRIVGQGIDVNKFESKKLSARGGSASGWKVKSDKITRLITIGRISPVKDIGTLIKAVDILVKKGINVKLYIVGKIGLSEQDEYYEFLQKLIKEKKLEDNINFAGAAANKNIVKYLQKSDIFVSASQTGSLDKTFLEAMSCGLPVIGCNEALSAVLGDYKKDLFYAIGDFHVLSKRIERVIGLGENDYAKMGEDLREVVVQEHGLERFVKKIFEILK
ncbi:glycosyltransferase family 4 protein [Candidatus Parcubacteria bacterium]|nr:glycosyltransferase family 4 protein [Candidatus Parcubacteria bacterium]